MKFNKLLFLTIWLLGIFVGLYTIKVNSTVAMVFSSKSAVSYLFERIFEVLLFIFLFYQVVVFAFLGLWKEKLGKWIVDFYNLQSLIIFIMFLGFTVSILMFNYFLNHSFDPFNVYLEVCVLCKTTADYFFSAGQLAFWLILIATFWRKFNFLYYFSFVLIAVEGYFTGYDFRSKPFYYFEILALLTFSVVIFSKLSIWLKNFKIWLED